MAVHAYIQQKPSGDWQLVISVDDLLPVVYSTHYSRFDAKKEAARVGAPYVTVAEPEKAG